MEGQGENARRPKWWITVILVVAFTVIGILTVLSLSSWHWPVGKHVVTDGPAVILISIDGLRHDMLSTKWTPNLYQLANEGVMVPMRPAYPSTTFPNHFTMITGLLPAHHGIIGNIFYDDRLGVFQSKDEKVGSDLRKWLSHGEPVWNAVEREGGRSAVVHYVGAGTAFKGTRPTYAVPFKPNSKPIDITDTILPFIRQSGGTAPNLVVGYYSLVDKMNHKYGPDSAEEMAALQAVDTEIGRIIKRIDGFGNTNLIIVSDHGAAKIEQVIRLSQLLALAPRGKEGLLFSTCSPVTYLYTRPQDRQRIFEGIQRAIQRHFKGKVTAYTTETIPKQWQFRDNHRLPSILIQAELGVTIQCDDVDTTADTPDTPDAIIEPASNRNLGGDHGFDPFKYRQMRSLFIAKGPRFKSDTLSAIRSGDMPAPPGTVDVYRVLTSVLELRLGRTDSTPRLSNLVLNGDPF